MTVRESLVNSERGMILLRAHHACVHGGNIPPPSALGVRAIARAIVALSTGQV